MGSACPRCRTPRVRRTSTGTPGSRTMVASGAGREPNTLPLSRVEWSCGFMLLPPEAAAAVPLSP
ncbi:hypothetical protein ACFFX0_11680 [Citricoccus parietis]|uniref:Uncharacterized protein n=1 Tax=Citricoccus parietis TaxID=592307 RepID=A0ABV5FYT0_9MICC